MAHSELDLSFPRALTLLAALTLGIAGCGGPSDAPADGAVDSGGTPCTRDDECANAQFCDGTERCTGGRCVAGTSPCVSGETCDEASDACMASCDHGGDADGDGRRSIACGGDDCDDGDNDRFPGHPEVCDADDHDEDCDPATFGARDGDGDGHVDARCCNRPPGNPAQCGDDCDDARPSVYTGLVEACDGLDNDCDSANDEGVLMTFFQDVDNDGFGDARVTTTGCSLPTGYAFQDGDECDDRNPSVNPAAAEVCNGRDDNCDGNTDPGCDCIAGTERQCGYMEGGSYVDEGVCEIGNQICVTSTWSNCTGDIGPSMESCNGLDDDCDAMVDETLDMVCYLDQDDDGYASPGATATRRCPMTERSGPVHGGCPPNFTARAPCAALGDPTCATDADCNDLLDTRSPGVVEACDGLDQNCDGIADAPPFACRQTSTRACTLSGGMPGSGMQTCLADCSGYGACSGPEVCNGADDNGDGRADETFPCAQGQTVACTNATCGTSGTGTCSPTCQLPTSCSAPEVCNFCDDNLDGMDDRGIATSTTTLGVMSCSVLQYGGYGRCTSGSAALNEGIGGRASGAWWPSTARFGWGPITFQISYLNSTTSGEIPADGMALVIARNAGSLSGAPGEAIGVPPDRAGLVVQWRFGYVPGRATDLDMIQVLGVRPDGSRYTIREVPLTLYTDNECVDAGPSSEGSAAQAGTLRVVYTPAIAGVSTATVDVLFGPTPATSGAFVSALGGPASVSEEPFARGDTLYFGMTAATGGAVSRVLVPMIRDNVITVQDTCP